MTKISAPSITEIEILQEGDGKTFPKVRDTVTIFYTSMLIDRKKFDSSQDKGSTFQCQIGVGQVVKGWSLAVARLSVGTRAGVTIPL